MTLRRCLKPKFYFDIFLLYRTHLKTKSSLSCNEQYHLIDLAERRFVENIKRNIQKLTLNKFKCNYIIKKQQLVKFEKKGNDHHRHKKDSFTTNSSLSYR